MFWLCCTIDLHTHVDMCSRFTIAMYPSEPGDTVRSISTLLGKGLGTSYKWSTYILSATSKRLSRCFRSFWRVIKLYARTQTCILTTEHSVYCGVFDRFNPHLPRHADVLGCSSWSRLVQELIASDQLVPLFSKFLTCNKNLRCHTALYFGNWALSVLWSVWSIQKTSHHICRCNRFIGLVQICRGIDVEDVNGESNTWTAKRKAVASKLWITFAKSSNRRNKKGKHEASFLKYLMTQRTWADVLRDSRPWSPLLMHICEPLPARY